MNTDFIRKIRVAIKNNDILEVERLIGKDKKKLNTVFVFGSWLHEAAKLGYIELAGKLLDMGIDTMLEAKSCKGSAVSVAASKGQIEMIKYLLSRGMSYDLSNEDANPLFCAIAGNQLETVRFLIDEGIDVGINYSEDQEPWTALQVAENCGNKEIIDVVKKAMENKRDNDLITFLEREVGKIQGTIKNVPIIDNEFMHIHLITPYNEVNYELFITDGMRQFTLSDQNRVELMVKVPIGWSEILLKNQKDKQEDVHWIYKWMIYLTYLPIKNNSTIVDGLIIPLGHTIFDKTEMSNFIYMLEEDLFNKTVYINDELVHVYEIMPLYNEECKIYSEKGVEELIKVIKNNKIAQVIDWRRKKLKQ